MWVVSRQPLVGMIAIRRVCILSVLAILSPELVRSILDPSDSEKRLMWKYPNCDHLQYQPYKRVDWLWYRDQLHLLPYPANIRVTLSVFENLTTGTSAIYDEEASICMMGLPTAFYYLTKYTLERQEVEPEAPWDPQHIQAAMMQYSLFENYISVFHPGLIDQANWTLTDRAAGQLRRDILRAAWKLEEKDEDTDELADRAAPANQQIRIYVYEEDEVPALVPLLQGQIYCSRGQWGMDVTIHDFFVTCSCRTTNPQEADFFFVPGYAICMLEGNLITIHDLDEKYIALVNSLPYFNASGGRDHVFVFGSGMAHSVFQSWRDYISQSIVLTPETELFNDFAWIIDAPFHTWRDIAIPGALDLTEVISLLHFNKPLKEREYLGAFFGRTDITRGPHPWVGGFDTRKGIIELMENSSADEFAFGVNKTHDVMHSAYGNARFCFVPRGKSGWSLRFFESLFSGCVPVMISDKWELPFEDFLDVTRFVIKWPSTQIGPQLLTYLRSLPDAAVQAYMDEAARIRCWYFYPPRKMDARKHVQKNHRVCPEENAQDAFQGILHLLERKRRVSRTSSKSFYFKDRAGNLQRVDANLRPLH